MSNLESEPVETVGALVPGPPGIEVLEPREVPLGGPRALPVLRTLPQRARSLIGAWCFADAYGPVRAAMDVPPHPHIGLQTVSWLYAGAIEHRDSTGAHAFVRPGQVNLMTAGSGIQHSEVSVGDGLLHGVQLWVALPDRARGGDPFFERHDAVPVKRDGVAFLVFVGEWLGARSPVTTATRLLGVQVDLAARRSTTVALDPRDEYGVLVDGAPIRVDGVLVEPGRLAVAARGATQLTIESTNAPARGLLLGGEPLGEPIVMWWNFVARSHEEIVAAREEWQADVVGAGNAAGRFGAIVSDPSPPLPAPALPNVRLRPRGA